MQSFLKMQTLHFPSCYNIQTITNRSLCIFSLSWVISSWIWRRRLFTFPCFIGVCRVYDREHVPVRHQPPHHELKDKERGKVIYKYIYDALKLVIFGESRIFRSTTCRLGHLLLAAATRATPLRILSFIPPNELTNTFLLGAAPFKLLAFTCIASLVQHYYEKSRWCQTSPLTWMYVALRWQSTYCIKCVRIFDASETLFTFLHEPWVLYIICKVKKLTLIIHR